MADFASTNVKKNLLSAVIITCDAEAVLPECLASLDFVDEILLVDSGSCDGTYWDRLFNSFINTPR